MSEQRNMIGLIVFIIGYTLLLYFPPILEADWVVDDHINLKKHDSNGDIIGEWTKSTYEHAGAASGHIWRPIPATIQHLFALLFGRSPLVFRGLNLGIHMINIFLLSWILWKKNIRWVVLLLLFWVSHPIQSEVICWSSDIYDLLMTTFLLISMITLPSRPVLGLISFFMAVLSKEVAIVAIPALSYLCWKKEKLNHILGILLIAFLYLYIHQNITTNQYLNTFTESNWLLQIESYIENLSWFIYVPTQAPFAHLSEDIDIVSIIFTSLGIFGVVLYWRNQPKHRETLTLSVLWWLSLLIPVGIGVSMTGVHGFRYTYAPLTLTVAALSSLPIKSFSKGFWLILFLWFGSGTFRLINRIPAWKNDMSLWLAEYQIEPQNLYVRINLGRQEFLGGNLRGVERWANAVESLDTKRQLLHLHREREALAKAAFRIGDYQLSLLQTEKLISELQEEGLVVSSNLWCIVADNQERLNLSFTDADLKCKFPQTDF